MCEKNTKTQKLQQKVNTMFKIALSLITLTSLAHATDPDNHDQFFGTSKPGTPTQHYVQPFQELPVEKKPSDSERAKTVISNIGDIGKNSARIVEDKSKLEIQRAENRIEAQAIRTEIKAQEVHEDAKKKSKKLEKKGKDKAKKLRRKIGK
jgi:hypothetical protein